MGYCYKVGLIVKKYYASLLVTFLSSALAVMFTQMSQTVGLVILVQYWSWLYFTFILCICDADFINRPTLVDLWCFRVSVVFFNYAIIGAIEMSKAIKKVTSTGVMQILSKFYHNKHLTHSSIAFMTILSSRVILPITMHRCVVIQQCYFY